MRMEQLDVQVGDVIVAASDGLFDNVFTADIVRIVTTSMKQSSAAGLGAFDSYVAVAEALSTFDTRAVGGVLGAPGLHGWGARIRCQPFYRGGFATQWGSSGG